MFFLSSLFSLSIIFIPSCSLVSNYQTSVYVTQVVDGDTFSSNQDRYRILGIDTPEVYDANNNFQPTLGLKYFYGKLASQEATRLLNNQWVEIETIKTDSYHRKVTKVKLANGNDYAIHMVKNGFAKVRYISNNKYSPFYYYDSKYIDDLYWAENEAKNKKLGFWSESNSDIEKIFN